MPTIPKEERPCNDIVERIVCNLGTATIQKVETALGIKGELQKILVDVDKRAIKLLGASDLLEELEEALYQADDKLNDTSFVPEAAAGNKTRTKEQVCPFLCSTSRLQKVTRKIWGFERELVERREREFRSELASREGLKDSVDGLLESKDVVGRNGDRDEILRLLREKDEKMEQSNVVVISIVGSTGIGKTQLAKLIFNDDLVKKHFNERLWISGFDSLILDYHLRYHLLPQKIEGKRFLIVVDDLCNKDTIKLKFLRDLLRCGANGSRAIVSTRSIEVAQSVMAAMKTRHDLDSLVEDETEIKSLDFETNDLDPEDAKRIYLLGCIDQNASLALFRRSMRLKEGKDPENLEQILEKCGGNPLAVRIMGSMFYLEKLGKEWQKSLDKWEIQKLSEERDSALGVLKLNYEHLPAPMKPCFAYCGLFPKNHEIDVQTLIKLWMSQGFIASSSSTERPEDVAYEYVEELHERLFFEDVKKDEWGKIARCKMQSFMHDLAREVAGIECATLDLEDEEKKIHSKTHHVSFDFHLDSPWQLSDSLYQAKRIRAIILPSQLRWQIEGRSGKSICDTIVSNLRYLRTLDLHNSGMKVVSDYIGELKHLRYLDLSQNTDIKVLPKSICRLSHLQTLKLNFCGRLEELPRDIKKLISLRNLEIDSCYSLTHMPRGIGLLTNLQTLSDFVLRNDAGFVSKRSANDQLDELKSLNSLKGELRVKNLKLGMDVTRAKLYEKTCLRSLILIWDIEAGGYDENTPTPEELKPNSNDLEDEETATEDQLRPNLNALHGERMTTNEIKPHSNDVKDEKTTEEMIKPNSNVLNDKKTTKDELKPHSNDLHGEETATMELKPQCNDLTDKKKTTEEVKPHSNDLKDERTQSKELEPHSNDIKDEKTRTEPKPHSNDLNEELKPHSNDPNGEKTTTKELKAHSNDLKDEKTTGELKPHSDDLIDEKTSEELKPNLNDLKDNKMRTEELKPHVNDLSDDKKTTKELKPHSNDHKDEKTTTDELKPQVNDLSDDKTITKELKPHSNDHKDEKSMTEELKLHSDDLKDERTTSEKLNPNLNALNDKKTATEELKPHSNDLNDVETTAKELKPHSNYLKDEKMITEELKELSLFAYSGVQFPSWLRLHAKLVKFSLWKCMKCRSLPPLNHLPHLKVLALEDMTELEFISDKVKGQTFFPSLKELRLVDLPRLQSWWSYTDNAPKPNTFPSLSELTIEDCPNLTSMPFSPQLQLLVLKNTSWTPFPRSLKQTTDEPFFLPELRTLRLVCISIFDLNNHWDSLPSLQSLTLDHLPYLKTLPEGLRHLASLKELHIWRCNRLKDISECVENLKSLEKLSLKLCLNLELPVQTFSSLASLQTKLEIEDCPALGGYLARK